MKVRFDLLVSAFFVAALAFAGCGENGAEILPPGPDKPDASTYTLSISGITADAAAVTVVPSNKTERYWVDVITKSDYNSLCSGTPAGLKTYLPTLIAARAQTAGKTVAALVAAEGKVGDATKNLQSLTAETDHVAFAIAVDAAGNGTSEANVEPFKTLAAVYVLTVTDVTTTTAKLNAVPKDKSGTYLLDCMTKATYTSSCSGTPEGFAAYVPGMLATLAEAVNMTIAQVVGILAETGDATYKAEELDPGTEYVAYAIGVNEQGQVTSVAVMTPFTTVTPTGTAPVVTLAMSAGDPTGADAQTKMTFNIKSSDVASCKYFLAPNAQVLEAISAGMTYESIVDGNGDSATAAEIVAINSATGFAATFIQLDSETEYCLIVRATGAGGLSTTEHMTKSTATVGEATDAYKAWIGTWTVTSTSSVVNKAPVSFDIVIAQNVANTTYSVKGWGISQAKSIAITFKFNAANGTFSIPNEQDLGRDEAEPAGKNSFLLGVPTPGGSADYSVVTGPNATGITATLSGDKQSATAVGDVVNIGGTNYTTAYMDYFFLADNRAIYSYNMAAGYTKGDYAIAPMTLTKKAAAEAASYRGVMPKAFELSREGRLAVSESQAVVTVVKRANAVKLAKTQATDEASIREMMRRR